MKRITACLLAAAFCALPSLVSRADEAKLDPHLEPLRKLLEKTWKGQFKNPDADAKKQPMFDVMHWERALNGRAVRLTHSVNDGIYGGETIIMWDDEKKAITYHYFTTSGDRTTGTMEIKDGKFISREKVIGNANGVTEVRATSEFLPDGSFHLKAEYCKDGTWSPGHEVTYLEDATAKVVFK
jgi:hypothetical protein